MPASIKIIIELDVRDSDIVIPLSVNQFTGYLGINSTKLSQKCINNLISNNNLYTRLSSIQYFYYYTDTKPDW